LSVSAFLASKSDQPDFRKVLKTAEPEVST